MKVDKESGRFVVEEAIEHGTMKGYRQHKKNGERPCTGCAEARAEYSRDLRAATKAAAPPAESVCGTSKGYYRHRNKREVPCAGCKEARREAQRRYRERVGNGEYTAKPGQLIGWKQQGAIKVPIYS